MLAVEIASEVFALLGALVVMLLSGGIAAVGWTVNLLWRITNTVSRMEERMDDMERRMQHLEARP
jgi:hypothetical protein